MHDAETAAALSTLRELTRSGVELWRTGDQVHYRATEGTLTSETLHWLKENKTQVLNVLSHDDPAQCLPGTSVERSIVMLARGNLDHHVACVHALDGSPGCYFDLARELARCGIGTYGIHSLDLDQKKGMPTTVAAITSEYADQLMRVKPSGPFLLVGWSSGALFSFEIARELLRRGREVRRLVLLDPALVYFDADGVPLFELHEQPNPAPPTGLPPCPPNGDGQLWWHFLSLISAEVAAGGTYPLDPAFWEMDDRARCEYLCANRRNQKLIKPSCMLNQANTPDDVLYIFNSLRNQAIAVANYRPAFLQTSVSLFISADDASYTPEQIDAWVEARESMWKRLSAGFDLCTRVRGGHTAVVARPCVETVAQHIAAAIWSQT